MTRRAWTSAALVLGLLFSSGCGLKGPLYLPEGAQKEVVAPPAAPAAGDRKQPPPLEPAPQSQKKDRAASPASGTAREPVTAPPDPDRPATPPPPDR